MSDLKEDVSNFLRFIETEGISSVSALERFANGATSSIGMAPYVFIKSEPSNDVKKFSDGENGDTKYFIYFKVPYKENGSLRIKDGIEVVVNSNMGYFQIRVKSPPKLNGYRLFSEEGMQYKTIWTREFSELEKELKSLL